MFKIENKKSLLWQKVKREKTRKMKEPKLLKIYMVLLLQKMLAYLFVSILAIGQR